ncbi:MAG: UbiA family prenyltransferase [Candidatus Omnitrophota bacterium]
MTDMLDKIKHFIKSCEELPMSLGLWLATALSIIYLRDSLECIVSVGVFPVADLFHLLHVPIFFISLLLAIILILHFFSKEEITKVSKISLIFFTVILLPVTIDFIISRFVKREIVYQYIMENMGIDFIHFFNPFFRIPEIPYSLRIEIAIVTLWSFLYIFLKRNKIFLSLLGAFIVFCLCFFHIAIPNFLINGFIFLMKNLIFLFRSFFLQLLGGSLKGMVDERIVVTTELLFTLFLLIVWYWRYDANKSRALFRNLRITRLLHYSALVLMGTVLFFYDTPERDLFVLIKIGGMLCALFFAFQFSVIINDIFDVGCDSLSNKDRPLITGVFRKEDYLKVGWVYLALALLFAIWVSDFCFIITVVFLALYFIYSAPPLQLKRFYPVNVIIIGLQALLAFLLGQVSLAPDQAPLPFYPSVSWLIFIIFVLGSHIKDLKDSEGDRSCNVMTLLTMLGEKKARHVTAGLVLLSYLLTPFIFSPLFSNTFIFLFALLFGVANYFYIRRKDSQENVIFGTYLIYGAILFFFLVKSVFFS